MTTTGSYSCEVFSLTSPNLYNAMIAFTSNMYPPKLLPNTSEMQNLSADAPVDGIKYISARRRGGICYVLFMGRYSVEPLPGELSGDEVEHERWRITPGRIRAQAIFNSSLRLVDDQSNSLTRSARLTMPRAGRVTMPLTVTSRSEPDRRKSTQSGCSKESYPATGTGVWSNRARIAAATAQNLCAATLKTADELVTAQSAGTAPHSVMAGRA